MNIVEKPRDVMQPGVAKGPTVSRIHPKRITAHSRNAAMEGGTLATRLARISAGAL